MSLNNGVVCSFKAMNDKISKLEGLMGSGVVPLTMVEVTYSELKSLRDNKQLTPGCWYRITDYECTTLQENTASAGHQFDILVLATSESTLSEEARAIQHVDSVKLDSDVIITAVMSNEPISREAKLGGTRSSEDIKKIYCSRNPAGDMIYNGEQYYCYFVENMPAFYIKSITEPINENTIYMYQEGLIDVPTSLANVLYVQMGKYVHITSVEFISYFANSNLNAWKIWYCLDNDFKRFAWTAAPSIGYDSKHFFREPSADVKTNYNGTYYAWLAGSSYIFTQSDTPEVGNPIYFSEKIESIGGSLLEVTEIRTETYFYNRYPELDNGNLLCWKDNLSERYIYTNTDLFDDMDVTELVFSFTTSDVINDIPSIYGKGIIYRMIDEWGNDCPYDFKNIQYILPIIESGEFSGLVDTTGSSSYHLPLYTFGWYGEDATLLGGSSGATLNIIGSCYEEGVYKLPVVHLGYAKGTQIGVNCSNVFLGDMKGGIVCPYCTDIDYQSGGRDDYHHYEWFGRARNGSVVQTNLFGTET